MVRVRAGRLAVFFLLIMFPLASSAQEEAEGAVTTIAVGSCANQERRQPIWNAIVEQSPDMFLFLGDNVYADTEDMDKMRACYEKLGSKPGFQTLRETCPIIAVWDDHDYGADDAGAEFPKKVESEQEFHRFFRTPEDADVRKHPGVYNVQWFGEPGRRLQVISLDTRYFRSPLVTLPLRSRFGPHDRNRDSSTTILGEDQWKWLREQLEKPADIRVILSSIQVLPQEHRWELWENFPHERARLLRLLRETGTGPVLFVSGDRHMGEISRLDPSDPFSPGFPVYELTSSGLTHAGGGSPDEPNRHRVSSSVYQELNFGLIQIDWSRKTLQLQLRNVQGVIVESYEAAL